MHARNYYDLQSDWMHVYYHKYNSSYTNYYSGPIEKPRSVYVCLNYSIHVDHE